MKKIKLVMIMAMALLIHPLTAKADTIAEIVSSDANFSTLKAALDVTDLTSVFEKEGNFTVFAPTDDAFAKLPEGTVEYLVANPDKLKPILLYHVAASRFLASDVVKMMEIDTLLSKKLAVRVTDGNVFINDSQITAVDIEASNGVIHVIDSVLLPPSMMARNSATSINIVERLSLDDRFSTLISVVKKAGLASTLSGTSFLTVFAPTNAAFKKIPSHQLNAIVSNTTLLKKILLFHVAKPSLDAKKISSLFTIPTVGGNQLEVSVKSGKVFFNRNSQLLAADIKTKNGVIHVIDTVLVP